nr:gamma-glutamyl-gamma-aminobutyrate hydrolase family protein [Cupriavidus sp. YR651]
MSSCHTNAPLVGAVCDRFSVDERDQHGVKECYRRALSDVAGVAPIFIPATGAISDVTPYLRPPSGLLLPGGASKVAPALYGREEPAEFPLDPARDSVAMQPIRGAVSRGRAMLAIGHGFQEMNVAFGGTLQSCAILISDVQVSNSSRVARVTRRRMMKRSGASPVDARKARMKCWRPTSAIAASSVMAMLSPRRSSM